MRLVLAAGGVPVMAHPRAGRRGRVVTDDDIVALAAAGLAGIEADHPDHTPAEREAVRDLGRRLGLLVTGSSDYHGPVRPNALGEFTTDPAVYEAIVAAGRGSRVGCPGAPGRRSPGAGPRR